MYKNKKIKQKTKILGWYVIAQKEITDQLQKPLC